MYDFEVESAHVLQFARAIGDLAPELAGTTSLRGAAIPPTFLMAAAHFDPDYPRRPRPGTPWIGTAGARATSAGFHLSQEFEFLRPVRVGDVLTVDAAPTVTWHSNGRRVGRMDFEKTVTTYRDPDGDPVAYSTWVSARVERTPEAPTEQDAGQRADPDVAATPSERRWSSVLVEHLTRTQIVMYAGASGDFHPTHIDETYAVAQGYRGVFAHGMLTMGMSGRVVSDRYGHAGIASFGGRMTAQVWPGDTLTATAEVARSDGPTRIAITTRNQRGEVVFAGHATLRPELD